MLYLNTKISEKAKNHLIYHSNQICKHTFDFLGTGEMNWGDSINWHIDIKSKYQWDNKFYTKYTNLEIMPGNGIDIKIPWELNRLQHLVTLGQTYVFTKDKKYSLELCKQLNHWIESNRFCNGINWINTMEVGIRVINIIVALDLIRESKEYRKNIEQYIYLVRQHGLYIENNLEIGFRDGEIIAANHYLANICGLFIIGLICDNIPESRRWLKTGILALECEMDRMVLDDGFFFEASTSYHRLAVELFLYPLIFANKLGIKFSKSYNKKLEKMLDVILYLTTPNGTVPQIGDNDNGRLLLITNYTNLSKNDYRYLLGIGAAIFNRPDYKYISGKMPEEVLWLLGNKGVNEYTSIENVAVELKSNAFHDSGLFVIRNDAQKDYAVICAQDSQRTEINGAHSHNDDLSFELWISGKPIFIDPGTYCYSSNKIERNRFRSTGMHNTIKINEKEINQLYHNAIFKLKRNSKIVVEEWSDDFSNPNFKASNDAFKNNNNAFYIRTLRYNRKKRLWLIHDQLTSNSDVIFESILHSIEKIEVISSQPKKSKLKVNNCLVEIKSDRSIKVQILKSNYSQAYGKMKDSFIAQIKGSASIDLNYTISPI